MTPHITAKKEQIAKIVLMPGDPLRAKFIAENFLKDFQLVNDVRGMLAYTGTYQGHLVTVMGHGMGNPSIGIYSYELFHFYNVDTIIRIGSCGSFLKETKLGDIVIAKNAISNSLYAASLKIPVQNLTLPSSSRIHDLIIKILKQKAIPYFDGNVLSSDSFYGETSGEIIDEMIANKHILAVEMEAFALYANAIKLNKNALTILTVSDSLISHEEMSADARRTSFTNMISLALDAVVDLYENK